MELKTDVGVKIAIVDDERDRFIVFDRPVKTLELTKEESSRLGASLIRDRQVGITAEIRKLIEKNYFAKPRRFREIFQELRQSGVSAKSASLNMILAKMVERKEIKRNGQRRAYLYST